MQVVAGGKVRLAYAYVHVPRCTSKGLVGLNSKYGVSKLETCTVSYIPYVPREAEEGAQVPRCRRDSGCGCTSGYVKVEVDSINLARIPTGYYNLHRYRGGISVRIVKICKSRNLEIFPRHTMY